MSYFKFSLLPIVAALLATPAAMATDPHAVGSGSVNARVATAGTLSIGNQGSALSFASSSQSTYARTITSATSAPDHSTVRASVAGETATRTAGMAYNTSTGTGTGSAVAGGTVNGAAQGEVGIHGLNTGASGGRSGTTSSFDINAARNQGGSVQGNTASGFETILSYDRTKGVTVNALTTGFVSGSNATATLAGMNAAGVASIQASGFFNGTGQATGGTGSTARP